MQIAKNIILALNERKISSYFVLLIFSFFIISSAHTTIGSATNCSKKVFSYTKGMQVVSDTDGNIIKMIGIAKLRSYYYFIMKKPFPVCGKMEL